MPAGQWVAFEGDDPHDCKKAQYHHPHSRKLPTKSGPMAEPSGTLGFEDFEIPATVNSSVYAVPPYSKVSSTIVKEAAQPVALDSSIGGTRLSRTGTSGQSGSGGGRLGWVWGLLIFILIVGGVIKIFATH